MVKTKSKIFAILFLSIITVLAVMFGTANFVAYAENAINAQDGIYRCGFSVGGTSDMGASRIKEYINSTFTVEKSGDTYYVAITWDCSALTNFTVSAEVKTVGYETLEKSSGRQTNRYTFGTENIQKAFSVSAYIPAMGRSVSFTLKANIGSATFTDNLGDMSIERPAEFVPVLTTSAGNEYEVAQGSVFAIPEATAVLGTEECTVTTSAYYVSNGERQTVEITDNRFTVANVGEYHLVYKASSPSYKTSLGNDAYTEYDVKIISSVGGSTLAKFKGSKGVLPEGTAIMASRIIEGSSVYAIAADKMKTIADNFEVFGVSFVSGNGNNVSPSENIELYLQANTTYDRTEIVVYFMDESGSLTKLNSSGYGRYVKVDTDKTGTFIVCIPGVAFVMPIWGYILIACGCGAIIIAAAITIPIVVVKHKRKKKRLAASDESNV